MAGKIIRRKDVPSEFVGKPAGKCGFAHVRCAGNQDTGKCSLHHDFQYSIGQKPGSIFGKRDAQIKEVRASLRAHKGRFDHL